MLMLETACAALWVIAAFQALLIVALLRQIEYVRGLLIHVEIPSEASNALVGARAPAFRTVDINTGEIVTDERFSASGGILLFLSSSCGACRQLAASLNRLANKDQLVVVCDAQGIAVSVPRSLRCCVKDSTIIASSYGVKGFPTAVVIRSDLHVSSHIQLPSIEHLHEHLTLLTEPRAAAQACLPRPASPSSAFG